MKYIDLRSDTVTQPTEEMRKAMAQAIVGDDVYGDDPTVNQLETLAANMLGKPAAIFVSSGTMGNQLAVMAATNRGDEIILGNEYHIYSHEAGAVGILSGANMCILPFPKGMPDIAMIEAAIRTPDIHHPKTSMICLENALGNGRVVPEKTMAEIYALAKSRAIHLHVDGARLFNAATTLGYDVKELTKHCDSVMVCLAKGLCAPVGSIVAGEKSFIDQIRKYRKILGGGMRQAGILAAAGIIGLETMTKRLGEDHENAKYLAEKLAEVNGVTVDTDALDINMVFFKLDKSKNAMDNLPKLMLEKGVKINDVLYGGRFVTSNDISKADIDNAVAILKEVLATV